MGRRANLAGLAALALGCSTWQTDRVEVVEPIHELLHHAYPAALESGDPAELSALFARAADPQVRAPTAELRAGFAEIHHARAHVQRVDLESQPVRSHVVLQVEGLDPQGEPRRVDQDKHWTVVREGGVWRIASDPPTPLRETPRPGAFFFDEATLRGLWFQHEAGSVEATHREPQRHVFGSGVAASDVDGDGWDDVFLLSAHRIELFLNREGSFTKVSEEWGLGDQDERVLTVALPVDFDGDGLRDLFVGAEYGQPLLFRNTGGRFEPVADPGLRTTERTISAIAADFDGNGLADLYLANHENVFVESPEPPGFAKNAEADQLFLNQGGFRFRDATREAGLGNTGWTLTPVAADYDRDGDVDLFVGNDFGADRLYRNDGHARFDEVSDEAGVVLPVASMGADWGDFDGDGDFDLFIGGMFSGSGWILEAPSFQIQRVPRVLDWMFRPYVREAVRSWFRGNRLYENRGDGTFREVAADSGASNSLWSWATVWLDFDNDGRLDLYGLNGFVSGPLKDDL
ncbi:MAG: FG-GAP-like repeat-containing protein [Myxococcota bacterium]